MSHMHKRPCVLTLLLAKSELCLTCCILKLHLTHWGNLKHDSSHAWAFAKTFTRGLLEIYSNPNQLLEYVANKMSTGCLWFFGNTFLSWELGCQMYSCLFFFVDPWIFMIWTGKSPSVWKTKAYCLFRSLFFILTNLKWILSIFCY